MNTPDEATIETWIRQRLIAAESLRHHGFHALADHVYGTSDMNLLTAAALDDIIELCVDAS